MVTSAYYLLVHSMNEFINIEQGLTVNRKTLSLCTLYLSQLKGCPVVTPGITLAVVHRSEERFTIDFALVATVSQLDSIIVRLNDSYQGRSALGF